MGRAKKVQPFSYSLPSSYLEAHMRGINGHRDGTNSSHGNQEVLFAPGLDIYPAGQGGTRISRLVTALLILRGQSSPLGL